MRWILLALLLLAGCTQPPAPIPPKPVLAPVYDVTILVVQEPAAAPFPGAEIYVVPQNQPDHAPFPLLADGPGMAHMAFPEPTGLLVQAIAPGPGFTREGGTVQVGPNVTSDLPVLGRTATIRLFPSKEAFHLHFTWGAATQVQTNGTLSPTWLSQAIPLPAEPALRALYLDRLYAAHLVLSWQNGATSDADLSVGLGWQGQGIWVEGQDHLDLPGPGAHTETFDGVLPANRTRAADSALDALAITRHPIVGQVEADLQGTLSWAGRVPANLAAPPCWPGLIVTPC
ncbi:MAG: hypothetical protein ACYDBQ_00320 [Thermoplasmatota archaeon]